MVNIGDLLMANPPIKKGTNSSNRSIELNKFGLIRNRSKWHHVPLNQMWRCITSPPSCTSYTRSEGIPQALTSVLMKSRAKLQNRWIQFSHGGMRAAVMLLFWSYCTEQINQQQRRANRIEKARVSCIWYGQKSSQEFEMLRQVPIYPLWLLNRYPVHTADAKLFCRPKEHRDLHGMARERKNTCSLSDLSVISPLVEWMNGGICLIRKLCWCFSRGICCRYQMQKTRIDEGPGFVYEKLKNYRLSFIQLRAPLAADL